MSGAFEEQLHEGHSQRLSVDRVIADERSEFQHIFVFENGAFGRVLALDGIVQITERDEAPYSEMLVHPPAFEHGAVRRALIVGGGDGAVAEELLKHRSVEAVDLVDIDRRVVELAREHLRSVHLGAFEDPRLAVHFRDAFEFLGGGGSAYDLVIADRPDPVGPGARLFEEEFYRRTAAVLAPGGIAVFQSGAPFFQADELRDVVRGMRAVWPEVAAYLTVVPTYGGGYFALTRGAGSPVTGALLREAAARARAAGIETRHYTPEVHRAAYALPPWLAGIIDPGR